MGLKAKTIKAILRKKIDKWVESIDDKEVKDLVSKNVIVTGGSIVSMLLGEDVNDFDVYFRSFDTTLKVAKYYIKKFTESHPTDFDLVVDTDNSTYIKIKAQSAGIASKDSGSGYEYFETKPDEEAAAYTAKILGNTEDIADVYEDTSIKVGSNPEAENKFRPVFLSSNAITLSDKIQIVLRFFGEPAEIHDNYDFVHCTSYWTSWDSNLTLNPGALESILSKELRYIGSKYPICSVVRLRKFIARGWRINAGQILKMCMQIGELDLTSVAVLEDQLTGVDTAYFVQLIARLKEKDPEKINSAYLVEIIDRMF